jgi:LPS sulfotransferase NodH
MQPSLAPAPEVAKIDYDMSAACDFPRTECRFKYLICSTPRSGSWLLCSGLAATGRAGRPAEFYSRPSLGAYCRRFGRSNLPTRSEYIRFLLEHRTSPNGVFGMKMHFDQLEPRGRRTFLAGFDRLILLTRADKLAQAVSFWKARTTRIYRASAGEGADRAPATASYSFSGIAECLHIIATQEADWRKLLAQLGERTILLTYEELADNYVRSVAHVLRELGLGDAVSAIDPQPQVLALRDRTNIEWEQRFMNDLRCSARR